MVHVEKGGILIKPLPTIGEQPKVRGADGIIAELDVSIRKLTKLLDSDYRPSKPVLDAWRANLKKAREAETGFTVLIANSDPYNRVSREQASEAKEVLEKYAELAQVLERLLEKAER